MMRRYGRRRRRVRLSDGFISTWKGWVGRGLTFADLGTKRDILGRSTFDLFLGRHVVRNLELMLYGVDGGWC